MFTVVYEKTVITGLVREHHFKSIIGKFHLNVVSAWLGRHLKEKEALRPG